jgi:Gas vesicle protein G
VGLLSGLLTFPLAPVRGVAWIAERLQEQAYEQAYSPAALQRQLSTAQNDLDEGRLSEEEYEAIEDLIVDRLLQARHDSPPTGV